MRIVGTSPAIQESAMNPLKPLIYVSTLLAVMVSAACVSGAPATAQSHDDTWCSNHPKQCDNRDWCEKNAGKCATASTGN
jgi:hypothetical protein